MKLSLELSLELSQKKSMKLSLKLSLELSLKNINKLSLELSLELGVVHLVPAGTRNHALTVPADAAAPPESRRRCRLDVGTRLADRERSWSFLRSRPGRRRVGTTAPGVWRRSVAWVRPPVERRLPSAHRRGAAVVRRVPPLSERRHRPRSSSPPPVVVTAPVVVTDTICNPGASAAAPEFPPSTRPLADPATTYPYIYRLVLLTSQPERVFIQPARIAACSIFHQFILTH